jgi:catechol 2,3-dioxygenase-like lactoylglutathione lyase family enzyme
MRPALQHPAALLLAASFLALGSLGGQPVEAVAGVSLTVSSLEAALPFYTEVLSFEEVERYELSGPALGQLYGLAEPGLRLRAAVLQLGQERIELLEFVGEERQLPIPEDSRSNDRWFQHIAIVVSNLEAAYQHLRKHEAAHISSGPQILPAYLPAAAGIGAFYFRDPDGHPLELIHFPPGKGDPRWQAPSRHLFLGIDHSAIGVGDSERSEAFYAGALGLRVAGRSENHGSEQEHLNQVFGARLLITGLRAKQGMGIEFLHYLAPPGGRPFPPGSRPSDLWHWHSALQVRDARALHQQAQAEGWPLISSALVELGGQTSFLLRDPDGHAVMIRSRQ